MTYLESLDRLIDVLDHGHMASCEGTRCAHCTALTMTAGQLAQLPTSGLSPADVRGMVRSLVGDRRASAAYEALTGRAAA